MHKFTKGPWEFLPDNMTGKQIFGGSHRYPIGRADSYWRGPGPSSEEATANAVLMASAPELLEALSDLIDKSADMLHYLMANGLPAGGKLAVSLDAARAAHLKAVTEPELAQSSPSPAA